MASTTTTFSFAIKDRYKAEKVNDLTMSDHPFLAHVAKDETFQGDATHIPLINANPQGIAASSLAVAQTNASNVVGNKFQLTTGKYQGSVSIGDEVIKKSRGNEGAFIRNKITEIDGLYTQMSDNISVYCFSNGGNSLGVVGSISTDDLTLSEPSSVVNFEVGMECVFSANDGSGSGHSLRDSGANALIESIDREGGVLTFASGELAAVSGLTAGDNLFREGDFIGNTGTTLFTGIPGFIWASSSSVPNLYGMTRTSDPTRLAGCRVASADLVGRNIEERLQLLGSYMTGRYHGPGGDRLYMNPEDWQNLAIALGSRVQIRNDKETRWGFDSIVLVLGGKTVNVYADRHCPKGTAFLLRMQNWKMHSVLKLIHPIEADGLTLLRAATTNDYEYRLVSYPALCTNAPGWSGRVSLT